MKLQTTDNQLLEVEEGIVSMFNVLKTMLQDLGSVGEGDDPVPVQVDLRVLQQVVTWCQHHKNDPVENNQSSSSSESSDDEDNEDVEKDRYQHKRDKQYDVELDPWDEKFLKELDPENEDAVFPLILAANFLDIPKLLDVCCKHVAGIIRGRTPQWIRKRFRLTCDFTEEQKAKIREELKWYDENIKISDDEEPQPMNE